MMLNLFSRRVFLTKCFQHLRDYETSLSQPRPTVGIRVPRIGVFSKSQLKIMMQYHEVMDTMAAVSDTMEWIQASSISRLAIPIGLNEYSELEKSQATVAVQRILLTITRESPFGHIRNDALLRFREEKWLNDDCLMHGMTSLHEDFGPIGIISPAFCGTYDIDGKYKIIEGSEPFHSRNGFVLLPFHLDKNHWCGAMFNMQSTPKPITIFDPQHKRKHLEECEAIIKTLFGDTACSMVVKIELGLNQSDGYNCVPLVLLFFECTMRGIALPASPSKGFLRYIRVRYLLKALRF